MSYVANGTTSLDSGLGENVFKTYFTAVANTDDYNENSNSYFVNSPEGYIKFNKKIAWNTALVEASIPHVQTLNISDALWYKRWNIPEKNTGQPFSNLYEQLTKDGWLFTGKYAKVLDKLPRLKMRPDVAKKIVNDTSQMPDMFEKFLKYYYSEYPKPTAIFKEYYKNMNHTKSYSMFTVEKNPSLKNISDDCFDVLIRRTNLDGTENDRQTTASVQANEGASMQIIRMSRSLAILMGIDDWEDSSSFPVCATPCESNVPTDFSPQRWYSNNTKYLNNLKQWMMENTEISPDIIKGISPSGTFGWQLSTSQRAFGLTILNKTWNDDTPYSGDNNGNNNKNQFTVPLLTDFTKDYNPGEDDYIDIFVVCFAYFNAGVHSFSSKEYYDNPSLYNNNKSSLATMTTTTINSSITSGNDSLRVERVGTGAGDINPPLRTAIALKYFDRGVAWRISEYLLRPVTRSLQILTNKINDNIYSGNFEPTVAIITFPVHSKIKSLQKMLNSLNA